MMASKKLRLCIRWALYAFAAVILPGCGNHQNAKPQSQLAAKVGSYEITRYQLDSALPQTQGQSEQQRSASRARVLDHLVTQQLAVAQAENLKLDRTPQVVAQIDASKREILARAYFAQAAEGLPKPTDEEVEKYFEQHPNLFSNRQIYSLKEVTTTAKSAEADYVMSVANRAKSIEDVAEALKKKGIPFNTDSAVRAAEALPIDALPIFAQAHDGALVSFITPAGVYVAQIMGIKNAPVGEAQAAPSIARFIQTQRAQEVVEREVGHLRATTRIEYFGEFATHQPAEPSDHALLPSSGEVSSPNASIDTK